jgi:hypothetical protein
MPELTGWTGYAGYQTSKQSTALLAAKLCMLIQWKLGYFV